VVELASLAPGHDLAAAFGDALHLSAPPEAIIAMVADTLDRDGSLLVVDNCEHVVDDVADLVQALLVATRRVRVLATSREPIGIEGERVLELQGLSVPDDDSVDAVLASGTGRLFVDRAAAALDFVLDESNAPAVAGICRRLDGVPLAVELAVPGLRVLSAEQVLTQLGTDAWLAQTHPGRRGSPERHRALARTIDWSHRLLTGDEQRLLAWLSVFADRFDLQDAAAVCPPEVGVLDALSALVRKSMLVRLEGAPPSFRLLVPIRVFAAGELAASGEEAAARTAHANRLLAHARVGRALLLSSTSLRGHALLDSRRDDLRLALTWFLEAGDAAAAGELAVLLWHHWDRRYEVGYGLAMLGAILRHDLLPAVRVELLAAAAHLHFDDDDHRSARALIDEGVALAHAVGDERGRGRLLTVAGDVDRLVGRPNAEIEVLVDEARRLLARAGDTWWEADAERVATLLAIDRGDNLVAEQRARRCQELWARCGDGERRGGASVLLATVAISRGDSATATAAASSGVDDFDAAGDVAGCSHALHRLAEAHLLARRLDEASVVAERLAAMSARIGLRRALAESCMIRAEVAHHRVEPERAADLAAQAFDGFEVRGFAGDLTAIRRVAAEIQLAADDLVGAAELCDTGLVPFRQEGHTRYAASLLRTQSLVVARLGDPGRAAELCTEAQGLAAPDDVRSMADTAWCRAVIAVEAGTPEVAEAWLADSLDLLRRASLRLSPREVLDREAVLARLPDDGRLRDRLDDVSPVRVMP